MLRKFIDAQTRGPRRYACLREVLAEGYRILLGQGHDTSKKHLSDVSKEIVRNKTSSEKIGYTDTDLQAARESHGIAVRHVSPARHRP